MQLLTHVLRLGLGFFIRLFIVRHVAAQQSLDLVAYATADPFFGLGFFIRPVIVRHVVAQQSLDLVAYATAELYMQLLSCICKP